MDSVALLTVAEMSQADRLAIDGGVPGTTLMENAGAGVARLILQECAVTPTVVLCGPGNNGGDGFVVARRLADAGWPVMVSLLGDRAALKGDAAVMAGRWNGPIRPLDPTVLTGAGLIVDGIFGAGLSRPVDGVVAATVEAANASRLPIVAIDVPTGVHGDGGTAVGAAVRAVHTVTFFRKKPGHLLLPGRTLCGQVTVVDIGIPERVLERIRPRQWENAPVLWRTLLPWPKPEQHKYDRGHAVVASGDVAHTGAARMAARAALRAGAGLVTLASPPDALVANAAHLTAVMLAGVQGMADWRKLIGDRRKNAVLIGPGHGVNRRTREFVLAALAESKLTVLDADALTVFGNAPDELFAAIRSPCLLTPHDGEFARLFDAQADKLTRTREAAARATAAVLLKGADTVIAAPDGRAAINGNAPPTLATAGAGDVLAGFALGLMAQGMPGFEAGCAATWLHGEAARDIGPGLIAEDLIEALPAVLRRLQGTV